VAESVKASTSKTTEAVVKTAKAAATAKASAVAESAKSATVTKAAAVEAGASTMETATLGKASWRDASEKERERQGKRDIQKEGAVHGTSSNIIEMSRASSFAVERDALTNELSSPAQELYTWVACRESFTVQIRTASSVVMPCPT